MLANRKILLVLFLAGACVGQGDEGPLSGPGGKADALADAAEGAQRIATDQEAVGRFELHGDSIYWIDGDATPTIEDWEWNPRRNANPPPRGDAPIYVAADQTYVYMLDAAENSISRAGRFGNHADDREDLVILGAGAIDAPLEMAIDGTKLYYIGADRGIYEMDRQRGAERSQLASFDARPPHHLIAKQGRLYYLRGNDVEVIDLASDRSRQIIGDTKFDIDAMIADDDYLYYLAADKLWRVPSSTGQEAEIPMFGFDEEDYPAASIHGIAVGGAYAYAAITQHEPEEQHAIVRFSKRRDTSRAGEPAGIELVSNLESRVTAIETDGQFLYWANEAGEVYQLRLPESYTAPAAPAE